MIGLEAHHVRIGRLEGQLSILVLHLQMVLYADVQAFFALMDLIRTDRHLEVRGLDWIVLLFRKLKVDLALCAGTVLQGAKIVDLQASSNSSMNITALVLGCSPRSRMAVHRRFYIRELLH